MSDIHKTRMIGLLCGEKTQKIPILKKTYLSFKMLIFNEKVMAYMG